MTDKLAELDEHRGMAAQRSTETRRRIREVQADQPVLPTASRNSSAMP